MSRLPLRARLVAGFSATMLVVLAAAAGFVYWRVQYALDRGLDAELDRAADVLARHVNPDGTVTGRQAADATGVRWQVVRPDGTVAAHGARADGAPMVRASVLSEASADKQVTADTGRFLPAGDVAYRLRIEPVPGTGHLLVLGVRRDHRDEALRELLLQLAIAGAAALALTAIVGDQLARAALAPVERYRRRAQDIAHGAAGLRLDVPRDRDDEVTRLGDTLNEMLGELERSIERERRFVEEASHELRTPLTLLSSRIQLTRRRPRTVAEHEAVLEELTVDVDQLADLADQLLALGEALSAPSPTGRTTALLATTLHRAAAARDDDVVVAAPIPPGLRVDVAPTTLDRILTNLVDNALTHGRPPVTLRVRAVERPPWAVLEVQDQGNGMDPALLTAATGRFARAPEARGRPGAGLGLSLVESLVDRAGGELRLCHAGEHRHAGGVTTDVVCTHDDAMTVTVVLPLALLH